MFTEKELADIESWRIVRSPDKAICKKLQSFKFRITNVKEKRNCFCSKGQRIEYRKEFFEFWDARK